MSIDINKKNIIYWFEDIEDATKINKIVNYKLKKFGVTNYMVTAGKSLKKDELNKPEYKKNKVAVGVAPTIPTLSAHRRGLPNTTLSASTTLCNNSTKKDFTCQKTLNT